MKIEKNVDDKTGEISIYVNGEKEVGDEKFRKILSNRNSPGLL